MAGVSRQRTGIPGRDALDHHAARAALAVEVRLPAPSLQRAGWVEPTGRANARRGRENVSGTPRHCERSEAIHSFFTRRDGLLRCARNDGEGCFMPPLSLPVIARSAATKQSILSLRGKMDCFAALAMTGTW